jgi:LacI family transcriptional regulator, galactose operon repressor
MAFGASSFETLMKRRNKSTPTAIVCGNDNIALGALTAAAQIGLRAPHDFSITGFDDLTISRRFSPSLTTAKVDNQKIGVVAANQLLAAIDTGPDALHSIELLPELRVRESTGIAR